jgi:hypothetical protein
LAVIFSTWGALCGVKNTEKSNESHSDLNRHSGKFLVETSTKLRHFYRADTTHAAELKRFFSTGWPPLSPRVGPGAQSKRMKSAMKRTVSSPENMASSLLQRALSSTTFIILDTTHIAALAE